MATGLVNLYNALVRDLNDLTTENDPMNKYTGWTPWVPTASSGQNGALSNTDGSASNQVGTDVGLVTCISFTYTWDGASDKKIVKLVTLPVSADGEGTSVVYRSAGLIADTSLSPTSIGLVRLEIVPSDNKDELVLITPEDLVDGHEYVIKGEIAYTAES